MIVTVNTIIKQLKFTIMTTTYKVKDNYKKGRDGDLSNTAYRVLDGMTNNATFPNPSPDLATLKQTLQDYHTAYNQAANGDSKLVSAKNDKRAVLRDQLSKLATYVNSVADGDKTKLLSSGFPLARQKAVAQKLATIDKLEVDIATPTQATTSLKKRVAGARSYIHQYSTDGVSNDAKWVQKVITETSYTFTNLQPGVKYMFQIIAIGPNGQAESSPIISKIIQ
jgi:ATPase subunit of ABC transporter with duplicated ATPase domains